MPFIRKVWRAVAVATFGIALATVVVALILGAEIRIERQMEVVGPDEPVYYMIVRNEPLAAIQRELQKNPRVVRNSFIINGTLLAHAAGEGREDVVRLLLEMGADPNGRGRAGEYTPLMTAVGQGQEATAAILVEHGADPDLKGGLGSSPRQLAEHKDHHRMLAVLGEAKNDNGSDDSE